VVSFTLTLLATLYPSYRASKVNPAEALRYE
jgi:lipoprotein-releasing system permease protein